MPRVSIIIPNYNHGRFLERRIASVLNQTYQDFEVIFLDDASTDETEGVFSQFATDKRIRAVRNEINSGNPFTQWNRGISMAQGEYVWIAESDDYAGNTFLAELIERFETGPHLGLVYCASSLINQDGVVEEWCIGDKWKSDYVNEGRDECSNHLVIRNTIPNASAVLFRRSVYEAAGYADESMLFCGDWLTWVKMLLISDLAFVSKPLNFYRRHADTVTSKMNGSLVYMEEYYRVMSYIKENVRVSPEVLKRACQGAAAMWLGKAAAEQGRREWRRSVRIHRIAADVDPCLNLTLLKAASQYAQERGNNLMKKLLRAGRGSGVMEAGNGIEGGHVQ